MSEQSLFDRLGGRYAIDAAVDLFYTKVLGDDRVADFFRDVDMEGQRRKQKCFLSWVFGAPDLWDGKNLREAHSHLPIEEEHFFIVAGHLKDTLVELGVPEQEVDEVMGIAASTIDDVLNR